MTHKDAHILISGTGKYFLTDRILLMDEINDFDMDYPTEPIIIRRVSVRGGKEHTERIDEDGGREETRLMALKMEERGISSGVQVASRLWKFPSMDSALKPGKSQPCPHLDLINVGCFKPPSLW